MHHTMARINAERFTKSEYGLFIDDRTTVFVSPLLAKLNESGFITVGCQPGFITHREKQRAYLDGYVTITSHVMPCEVPSTLEAALALNELAMNSTYVIGIQRLIIDDKNVDKRTIRMQPILFRIAWLCWVSPHRRSERFSVKNMTPETREFTNDEQTEGRYVWHSRTKYLSGRGGSFDNYCSDILYDMVEHLKTKENINVTDEHLKQLPHNMFVVSAFDPEWGRESQLFRDILNAIEPHPPIWSEDDVTETAARKKRRVSVHVDVKVQSLKHNKRNNSK